MKRKSTLTALCICTMICATACVNNTHTESQDNSYSQAESISQETQSSPAEYFTEVPEMKKPSNDFGAEYKRYEDDIYYHKLSSDNDEAIAAMQLYMAELMNEGFELKKVDDSLYYMVYQNNNLVSFIGIAKDKDNGDTVLCISFFE